MTYKEVYQNCMIKQARPTPRWMQALADWYTNTFGAPRMFMRNGDVLKADDMMTKAELPTTDPYKAQTLRGKAEQKIKAPDVDTLRLAEHNGKNVGDMLKDLQLRQAVPSAYTVDKQNLDALRNQLKDMDLELQARYANRPKAIGKPTLDDYDRKLKELIDSRLRLEDDINVKQDVFNNKYPTAPQAEADIRQLNADIDTALATRVGNNQSTIAAARRYLDDPNGAKHSYVKALIADKLPAAQAEEVAKDRAARRYWWPTILAGGAAAGATGAAKGYKWLTTPSGDPDKPASKPGRLEVNLDKWPKRH